MLAQWSHRMLAWMNVCLSNGTDWIGQELFYFITWWELNNAPQIRAYLRLSLHLIQQVSQILPSLSLRRHGLCDRVKSKQAFTWYLTCEFCGAWHPVFGQLMEWTSGVSHAGFEAVWVFMGIKRNFMILVLTQVLLNDFRSLMGSLTFFGCLLISAVCCQQIVTDFNKS